MRGSTAKVLRHAARVKYREMIANKEINAPESTEHYRHQYRVLYQSLKKVFGRMPHDVKGKFAQPYRKLRIKRLDLQQSCTD
jgi:hypothetical protein